MTKNELIAKLTDEAPALTSMTKDEVEVFVTSIFRILIREAEISGTYSEANGYEPSIHDWFFNQMKLICSNNEPTKHEINEVNRNGPKSLGQTGPLEELEIDLIGEDIPDLAVPKQRRRIKASRIIRKPDPHLFHPPDEDDLLYDLDE